MPTRIASWCHEHDLAAPVGTLQLVRSIVHSLAAGMVGAVERAATLSGRRVRTIHLVGGGAQNAMLCQAIADRSALPVVAGPVEATALGNVLVQARSLGAVDGDLASLRALIARTHHLTTYAPAAAPEAVR
jgi:rhamnulokinase